MKTPENFVNDIEKFLNEQREDMLVLDTVLKVVITRLISPGSDCQLINEIEQQSLNSIKSYGYSQNQQLQPRIELFFSALRRLQPPGQSQVFSLPKQDQ